MPDSTVVKRLKKWNPLKLFKGRATSQDNAHTRAAYAGYKRRMAARPETLLKTVNYNAWRKSRKKPARPGE